MTPILDRVRELSPEVSARALETEAGRSVPTDLARKLGAVGAFHLFVPRALGGPEVDPVSGCRIVEEISRADASTGWTAMILNTTFFTCWLEADVARRMLASDPELGMAGLFSPVGRAEPAEGDSRLRLSGRWPLNSGSPHASWFCEGAFVPDKRGQPEWRFLFVPASEVRIVDTWHAAGLRGTASHDVVVDGALVPLEHTTNPIFQKAPRDEPHFRWSFFALLAALISGVPIGVARRALDEFESLAAQAGRGGGEPLATEQIAQLETARCESTLRAARSFLHESLASAWQTSQTGDEITRDQRLAIRLASANAMRAGLEVVDSAFRLTGGKALYEHNPLQRCWRDLHAASNHIFFSNNQTSIAGRILLGQAEDDPLI